MSRSSSTSKAFMESILAIGVLLCVCRRRPRANAIPLAHARQRFRAPTDDRRRTIHPLLFSGDVDTGELGAIDRLLDESRCAQAIDKRLDDRQLRAIALRDDER